MSARELADYAGALGIALDCLADEATVEQLTAAKAAAEALDSQAAAQLDQLIEARSRRTTR